MRSNHILLFLLWVVLVFFPFVVQAAPRSTRAGHKEPRYALVVAAIGDSSTHNDWLKGARYRGRNWDLVALYYGRNPKFNCKECRTVYTGQGAKWNLLYRFLKETKGFRRFAHRYAAIMIADDDLKMSAKEFNKFFDTMIAFNLTLAQPSQCMASTSLETTNAVARRTASLLHYTNFIELKAATFSGTFFDGTVRKSLGNGLHTGYGMEFVWPYLAGWGQNNNKEAVAVVDTICMHHSHDIQRKLIVSDAATTSNSKSGAGNTNDAIYIPTKPQLEWDLTMSRNNFTEELMENAGMTWKEATVFGDLDVATTVVPKVNWKKKLDKTMPDLAVSSENRSGVAVFLVLLVACGGLLVTGAATTHHTRRPKKPRY